MKIIEGETATQPSSGESVTPKYDHAMASVSACWETAEHDINKMTNLEEVLALIRLLEKAHVQLVDIRIRGERQAKKTSRQLVRASLDRGLVAAKPTTKKGG